MSIDWAEWGPPMAVLVLGVLLGGLYILFNRTSDKEQALIAAEGRKRDLERTRDAAIEALRELELDREKLTPEDYESERQALLARGAEALRRLESGDFEPVPEDFAAPAAGTGLSDEAMVVLQRERERLGEDPWRAALAAVAGATPARNDQVLAPHWVGAMWTLAVVGVVFGLYVAAGSIAIDRPPGGSITGNQNIGGGPPPGAPASEDPRVAQLKAQVAAHPDDVQALNLLTVHYLAVPDPAQAMAYNERALEHAPRDPDARVHRAVLSAMIGMRDRAIEQVDDVLVDHPNHPMAVLYKGLFAQEAGHKADAIAYLERALAMGVADDGFLHSLLERARALPDDGSPASAPPSPPRAGDAYASPHGSPASAASAASAAGTVVSGRLDLAPESAEALSQARALFVSVRDPAGGPPLAAVRLPPGPFPMDFRVTEADAFSMGGAAGPLPENLHLTARLAFDGDASRRSEGEPQGELAGVSRGTDGLSLTLR